MDPSPAPDLLIKANHSQIIIIDELIKATCNSQLIILNHNSTASATAVSSEDQLIEVPLNRHQEKEAVINAANHSIGLDDEQLWPKRAEDLDCAPSSPTNYQKPTCNMMIREVNYPSPMHDLLLMRESRRNSAEEEAARLSKVVEESESFSRREFGLNYISYMNCSNNHSTNYNMQLQWQSAPCSNASSTSSTQAFLNRGSSEGAQNMVAMGRKTKARKRKSLASTLLWPLLKIRNGYIGCMMSLDGAGDLSGMAQGGTFASTGKYFADLPLSKTDSRHHG